MEEYAIIIRKKKRKHEKKKKQNNKRWLTSNKCKKKHLQKQLKDLKERKKIEERKEKPRAGFCKTNLISTTNSRKLKLCTTISKNNSFYRKEGNYLNFIIFVNNVIRNMKEASP